MRAVAVLAFLACVGGDVIQTTCSELEAWYYDTAHSGAQACCDRNATHPRALARTPAEHATVVFHGKPRPIAWPTNAAFEVAWDHYNRTAVLRFPHVEDLAPFLNALLTNTPSLFTPYSMPSILLYVAHDRTDSTSLVPVWAIDHSGTFVLAAP
tara:strand:- start:450 stop:911 length:462 start_codon:yes stop_codon:yes gene_type:complete